MFDSLSDRLGAIFKKLRGRGRLQEADIQEALREVRRALLEADVSLTVVKDFVARIRERATGEELSRSLTPGQQVIKIVRDELVELMGGQSARLQWAARSPTVILMCGLHGAGKTTSTAKLALHLRGGGHHPLMAAADVYRPAAIQQLEVLGAQLGIPVYQQGTEADPVEIARAAVTRARETGRDVVLVDTAGRLHVDGGLMDEIRRIQAEVKPDETLLVVDAMTGQDAVNIAREFHEALGLTGVILTKLDGDARGGAALSVRHVTGAPIKFIGVGEKLSALEPFHPDRMAGRILGMGDVLSLIERAEQAMDEEKAAALEQKLREASFNLEDLLDQFQQIRKMGPLQELLGMIPGLGRQLKDIPLDESQFKRVEAVIQSMTLKERRNPQLLDASRKRRIARGSGTEVADVNRLLKQYEMMKKMMKGLGALGQKASGRKGRKGPFRLPF